MAKRIRVALIYSYNESWIAGAYYIENLINALNTLPDPQKPIIFIISFNEKDFERIKRHSQYPYLHFYSLNIKYNLFERIVNKIFRTITKKNLIEKLPTDNKVGILFPAFEHSYFSLISSKRKVYWIPDFQEDYLPQFFSEEEIKNRKLHQKKISENTTNVVFSSQDALNDFNRLYPNHTCKTFVLSFAVSHSKEYLQLDIEAIRKKYDIPKNYFFSPNQFWKHKNQIIILKALKILKERGENCFVAFSGKQEDYRNPDYFQNIQNYVKENQLENNVKFLGFIDRNEQLALMKHAKAIIQSSLFEGWSTVVEDAKAMHQRIILSNLRVHEEQIVNYHKKCFFNPYDEYSLVEKMYFVSINEDNSDDNFDYENNIRDFGRKFIKIVEELINRI